MEVQDFNILLKKQFGNEMFPYQKEYCDLIKENHDAHLNTLVNLPTGMGKTMALFYAANSGKTLYTVPIRALADEKLLELPNVFPNLRILRDTGADREHRDEFDYENQDVVITTTERLLSILNTNSVKNELFKNLEYIIFDEIHLLSDVNRGSTVEWIIMLLKKNYPHIHLIGLTATLSNYVQFTNWFDGEYYYKPPKDRPIPLQFFYNDPVEKQRTMALTRDEKFAQFIRNAYMHKEPFLIFIASKPDIERYARKFAGLGDKATLQQCMAKGVAFHHRDIDEKMKGKVIEEFIAGNVKYVFCSPTLAMGVNVPATNVAIFDISFWNDIAWQHEPLEEAKLRQMFGRAGRIGFSDIGRVFFYGMYDELDHARWCVENPQPSNSQFGRVIVDKILNMLVRKDAETGIEIHDIIKHSFLYHQRKDFDEIIIQKSLDLLTRYKLNNKLTEGRYKATIKGIQVVKFYISVHTVIDAMSQIHELKKTGRQATLYDFYRIFLGNDEYLSNVSYQEPKDQKFKWSGQQFFRKSDSVGYNLYVSAYDKDTNLHIPMEKSGSLLKVLALVFKEEIMGKKFRSLTQDSTLRRWRNDGAGLVSRLSTILEWDLKDFLGDKKIYNLMEMGIKYGTLNETKLELFSIEGFGNATIEKLLRRGITTKTKLFNLTKGQLKRYNVGISWDRLQKLQAKYGKNVPKAQGTLSDWY